MIHLFLNDESPSLTCSADRRQIPDADCRVIEVRHERWLRDLEMSWNSAA